MNFLEGVAAIGLVSRADNFTTFMCRLSGNRGASTSWNSQGLSRPVMGLLDFYIIFVRPICEFAAIESWACYNETVFGLNESLHLEKPEILRKNCCII